MGKIEKSVGPHAEMEFRGLGDEALSYTCGQNHLFVVKSEAYGGHRLLLMFLVLIDILGTFYFI